VIQISEWSTLNWKIRKISRKTFGPLQRTVEEKQTATAFSLEMLEQQPCHPTSTHNSDLLLIERQQLITAACLSQLELSQLHRGRAN
jgi:hypothetical protein